MSDTELALITLFAIIMITMGVKKSDKQSLKIAMLAPPWLDLYPRCYFGIENVVHNLTEELVSNGHHVELFTVGGSETKADKLHWFHKDNQYQHLLKPLHHSASILVSHILYSLEIIQKQGDFDIIHDHNNFIGPGMMAHLSKNFPPVLHTLHQPFTDDGLVERGVPDNRLMFQELQNAQNLYFNFISYRQKNMAPEELVSRVLMMIYNGVRIRDYKYKEKKKDFFLHVGNLDKGQGVAAKVCSEAGEKLKIAGIISSEIDTPEMLEEHINDPESPFKIKDDFKRFMREVTPYLKPGEIEFIGAIRGEHKLNLFADAKALLFPILWEEPFGIVAIEALASGTPIIAYNRGAMPEIIEHGVNGFLADTEDELKDYMARVDEINPEDCRRIAEEKFSIMTMAEQYDTLYRKVIETAKNN